MQDTEGQMVVDFAERTETAVMTAFFPEKKA